jgi:hypothetical protein
LWFFVPPNSSVNLTHFGNLLEKSFETKKIPAAAAAYK